MDISSKTDDRIPVTVVSGFLGSGKTTLLNRLLNHAPRSAVIINEFGATPIDQTLLRQHNVPLSVLSGGCLCCQVRGALTPLLKNLRMAWEAQADKTFDRILIETSGVASPEPVLDTLLRERWLAARYRLHNMVTTVSATSGADALSRFPEALAQIAWADTLVITQTDLAEPWQIENLVAQLNRLAPTATLLQAIQGDVEPNQLLACPTAGRYRLTAAAIPAHDISSITLQLDFRLAWDDLKKVLEKLTTQYPQQLIRLKGVVYTPDDGEPLSVQGAMGTLYPPVRLPARASDDGRGRLVFITAGAIKDLAENIMAELRQY
ncbi:MAG: GTP-binding protein [Methylovulum sp.]|nr:GTP-binding protein [Methylovulum sp.]